MLHDISKTYFTYFSGGDGAGLGLEAAGYRHMGGVESNAQIAAVAAANGHPLTVADVRSVDPALLLDRAPDWFHASPVCKNASQAKAGGEESDLDIETAQATARFIRHWLPATVSIENVWGYREFDAFKMLCNCLTECGYSYNFWHLNSADYGVPQTRRRLILVARRGLWYIQRPEPTHTEGGDMFTPAWIGWYEAIQDLIPTLPASRFADWQMERLPEELRGSLVFAGGSSSSAVSRYEDEPMMTIVSSAKDNRYARAFILDGQANSEGATVTLRHDDEPCFTIAASATKRPARAFIIAGGNTSSAVSRDADEPAMTIAASAKDNRYTRAWLTSGCVVSITPRALARFMSFPDWYQLPDKSSLACTVLGNACPPLLIQRVAESIRG